VSGAGGFGNALELLKDVAIEVWGRIGSGVDALVAGMVAGWEGMKAQFFWALHDMLAGFAKFVENIASGLNSIFGINLDVSPLVGVLSDLNKAGNDAFTSMQASGKAASSAWAAVKAPLASVQALRDSERMDGPAAPQSLFGLQTWLALPEAHEEDAAAFVHAPARDLPLLEGEGKKLRLILGTAWGETAPVPTLSEVFYADAELAPFASLPLPDNHEDRGIYLLGGSLTVSGQQFQTGQMLVFRPGDRI
jgi:hypothetical protein